MTLGKKRWLLDFAYPAIGERPVAEIAAPELLAVLRKVESRGRYETARQLRSTCGMVFRYAIATGRAERDPSVDLRGALTGEKSSTGPPLLIQRVLARCSEPSRITTDAADKSSFEACATGLCPTGRASQG